MFWLFFCLVASRSFVRPFFFSLVHVCTFANLWFFFFFLDVPSYYPCYGRDCPSYSYEVYGGEVEAAVPDLILLCMVTRRKSEFARESVCTAGLVGEMMR